MASVNEGMRLHAGRDVVLLNSDTEVAGDWLDRLAACAAREPRAGTVTPFSNNATIASYPRFAQPNALPRGATPAGLDAVFARANAGRSADLPTAVGFCMFIARACLEATGPFDEEAFGRGYGEEVDFCLRAAKAGWRHLLAADVFVFHEGEVSFGPGAPAIREKAQRLIDARHPEFQPRLADFIAREPVRPLRRAVDLERLRGDPRPRLLFVTHGWGGGIDKHVRDLARSLEEDAQVLLLRPAGDGGASLAWLREGEEFEAFFDRRGRLGTSRLAPGRARALERALPPHARPAARRCSTCRRRLGVGHDVTLHDYLAVCPQHHLADADGRYCGEPDEAGCEACLARRPPAWPLDIRAWRERFGALLAGARRVIAPSLDIASRHQRHFPGLATVQWPHPESETGPAKPPVRVLLPGGLAAIKGFAVVEACVRDALARDLPLHFRVLGHLERALPQWPDAPLSITGSYPDGTLDRLIALERGDVVFFPAQVPESFSYTLSAAMRSGLPIVASDLGALPGAAARLRRRHAGGARRGRERPERRPPRGGRPMSPRQYREAYLEPLASRTAPATPLPALPPRVFYRLPARNERPRDFEQLFDSGVVCGHGESRRALAARAREIDARADALEVMRVEARSRERDLADALRTHQEHVRSLEQAVEEARERVRTLEESTFWRMTGPMRAVAHRAKLTARASRSLGHSVRLLPARLGTARQILKDAGPGELARRLRAKMLARNTSPSGLTPRGALEPAISALHVPSSDAPLVSVIVPTYGQDLHTFTCLKALAREAARVPLEVIVMDDCAPVAAAQALAGVTGVRFERNAANLGFVRNCNRGATLARGEFLLFLNNDAVMMEGALEALLRVFDAKAGRGRGRARSSSTPTGASRRPAASSGATARRGTTAAATTRRAPSTTTCARRTTAPARACCCAASSSPRWAASTSATPRPTARIPTCASRCARPAAPCGTSPPPRSCTTRASRTARTRPRASSATSWRTAASSTSAGGPSSAPTA